MSIAEKLTAVAQNVPKVFEAGKKAQYDEFWDSFPANPDGTYLFSGDMWNDVTFKPKRNIELKNGANGLFYNNGCKNIKEALEKCGVTLNMSQVTGANNCFSYASTSELPALDLSNISSVQNVFAYAQNLVTVKSVRFKDGATFSNAFTNCKSLKNITILGTISGNGFNVSPCTELTAESLYSIVEALSPSELLSGLTVTFPSKAEVNYNDNPPLNAPQTWAELRATRPKWSFTYA